MPSLRASAAAGRRALHRVCNWWPGGNQAGGSLCVQQRRDRNNRTNANGITAMSVGGGGGRRRGQRLDGIRRLGGRAVMAVRFRSRTRDGYNYHIWRHGLGITAELGGGGMATLPA